MSYTVVEVIIIRALGVTHKRKHLKKGVRIEINAPTTAHLFFGGVEGP